MEYRCDIMDEEDKNMDYVHSVQPISYFSREKKKLRVELRSKKKISRYGHENIPREVDIYGIL
jgi:hypothetical protein